MLSLSLLHQTQHSWHMKVFFINTRLGLNGSSSFLCLLCFECWKIAGNILDYFINVLTNCWEHIHFYLFVWIPKRLYFMSSYQRLYVMFQGQCGTTTSRDLYGGRGDTHYCTKSKDVASRFTGRMEVSNGPWNLWQAKHHYIEFMIQSVWDPLNPVQPGVPASPAACASGDHLWRSPAGKSESAECQEISPKVKPTPGPPTLFSPAEQVIALIKVKERPPGSCSGGLMKGSSLNSQTW